MRLCYSYYMSQAATKTSTINARVKPALKRDAEAILASLGVTTTEAVTMFLHQIVLTRGLPFPVRVPNAETAAAIAEAREHPERVTRYAGVEDLMADLWPEDVES